MTLIKCPGVIHLVLFNRYACNKRLVDLDKKDYTKCLKDVTCGDCLNYVRNCINSEKLEEAMKELEGEKR